MNDKRRAARQLIEEAVSMAVNRGHNVELRRSKDGAHIPLFRYRATGKCTCCGASLVVDTSPPEISMNVPFGEKGLLYPTISGDAIDRMCDGKKAVSSPRRPAKRSRISKMSPAQLKRHRYFLRMAMSR